MTIAERKLVRVIHDLVAAENRYKDDYKDGDHDQKYSDAEMAARKRVARDNAISVTRELGYNILAAPGKGGF